MWNAIASVTTGLALIAFLAAVGTWIYRRYLLHKERVIKSAPKNKRAELIHDLPFPIKTENLTPGQMYDLAMEQLKRREQKSRRTAIVAVIISSFFLAATVVAIKTGPETTNTPPDLAENVVQPTIPIGKSTNSFNGALTIKLESTRVNPETGKYHVTASIESPGSNPMQISDSEANEQTMYTYTGEDIFDIWVLTANQHVAKFRVSKRKD